MTNLVTITDFANSRGEDRDTVNAFIRNHPEIKKFITKQGKHTVIDTNSEGYKLLEKQYPLPRPVEIIEDIETIKELSETRLELAEAHKALALANAQIAELNALSAKAEALQLLLEDKEQLLLEQKSENQKLSGDLFSTTMALNTATTQKDALEEELQRLRNRNLLERILNK